MLHYFIVLNTMKSHLLECVAMQNYKVEVQNHSEGMEAQDLFFAMGCRKGVCVYSRYPKLIVTDNNNNDGWYSAGAMIYYSKECKQITLQELRAMVAPKQKEYLVKTDTGYTLQVLSDVVDGHDGIIEVPEGSNIAWKDNSNGFVFFTKMEMGYRDATVIWQRESLNDQVASAEKARQEQIQCKCSTKELHESDLVNDGQKILDGFTQPEELPFIDDNAWNKQIGGDHYKKLAIQPMEYALQNKLDYAQANVVKYVTRHADKNGKHDLLKAIHNIELMIAHYYSDQE